MHKKCKKQHVDSIPVYYVSEFRYLTHNGEVYVNQNSIFRMFDQMGLQEQAYEFAKQVVYIKIKKKLV